MWTPVNKFKSITQQIQAGVLKLEANNNYDTENRKLRNVTEGTVSSDAITKHQLDTAMIDKHAHDQNLKTILTMASTANSKHSMKLCK